MPEEAGFSSEKLDEARQFADDAESAAVMLIYDGHVVAAWGDVERKFGLHSVRKSLVSALYGIAVADGEIGLDDSLADLGIDDSTPLTPQEKTAQVRDLIAARSGVFLPAAYAPSDQDENRPERGSQTPDTYWFYNNWDFNMAGVIYEQETGENLYEAFYTQIAQPIGMEDFSVDDGFMVYEPSKSKHPAHTFRMSTRDLARFGQLFLQHGSWDGDQIVPADWVKESTQAHSDLGDGFGYGYMWWINPKGGYGDRFSLPHLDKYSYYLGRGTGGQGVVVIPEANIVFVHRGDTDRGNGVRGGTPLQILDKMLGAQATEQKSRPHLQALAPVAFKSQQPPLDPVTYIELSNKEKQDYLGEYVIAPGVVATVFLFEGRLFGDFPGEGEAELFALGKDRFTIRVIQGVSVQFERDEEGDVNVMIARLGPKEMRAEKQ